MPCQEVPVLEFTAMQVKQTPEEHKKSNDCFIWSSMKEGILCLRSYIKPDSTHAGIIVKQGRKALETRELARVQNQCKRKPSAQGQQGKKEVSLPSPPTGKDKCIFVRD